MNENGWMDQVLSSQWAATTSFQTSMFNFIHMPQMLAVFSETLFEGRLAFEIPAGKKQNISI